jgi:hypothetical protein
LQEVFTIQSARLYKAFQPEIERTETYKDIEDSSQRLESTET